MEDDDTGSSPPPAVPDQRRRRPSVSAGAAQRPSALDTTRTCLFSTPGSSSSLGVPSSASQEDAYNTGQRVAKKRKGLGMPDSFDRLISAFQSVTEGLLTSQQGSTREHISAAQKMAQDTNATFLKVTFAPRFCNAFAYSISSYVVARLPCVLQLKIINSELTMLMRCSCMQGCEQVASAISGAAFATEMMNKMLERGHSFDEVLERLQGAGLLPRNVAANI